MIKAGLGELTVDGFVTSWMAGRRLRYETEADARAYPAGAGLGGLSLRFGYRAYRHALDVEARGTRFIAGAVLVGSGIVSLATLARRGSDVPGGTRDATATVGLPRDDEWRMKLAR